ncbi:acyl-CoA thioesterase domain-containing protein [Spongiactinospora sp. TRM90649]|uniref:acyl-CoA thioesterase n=1 Tax=Spongiactinospora sp. TRM90649 TaxID=3031114 RepID=UPI0023F942FC|nr:acyl-CoA thioesterase domain-containing protein [Spongiactinospora sp. TRM90649]MDF5753449.1 thioesterase family protein [Spongiactinospora sp. TRM90649]
MHAADPHTTAGTRGAQPAGAPGAGHVDPEGGVGALLQLERLESLIFRGPTHAGERIRLYGGEVAAQAMLAAGRTVPPGRALNSLGVYFLLPGDSTVPVIYKVGVARDGGTFSTRTVEGRQSGRPILWATASFQSPERGLSHQVPPSPARMPETLPSAENALADDPPMLAWLSEVTSRLPVEIRFPDGSLHRPSESGHIAALRVWLRTRHKLADSPEIHAAGLVYLSDLLMLAASLQPHPHRIADGNVWFATIGHSVILHAPARADDWLLYEVESDWAGAGRCLTRGRLFDRAGRLCASTTQEAVLRVSEAE